MIEVERPGGGGASRGQEGSERGGGQTTEAAAAAAGTRRLIKWDAKSLEKLDDCGSLVCHLVAQDPALSKAWAKTVAAATEAAVAVGAAAADCQGLRANHWFQLTLCLKQQAEAVNNERQSLEYERIIEDFETPTELGSTLKESCRVGGGGSEAATARGSMPASAAAVLRLRQNPLKYEVIRRPQIVFTSKTATIRSNSGNRLQTTRSSSSPSSTYNVQNTRNQETDFNAQLQKHFFEGTDLNYNSDRFLELNQNLQCMLDTTDSSFQETEVCLTGDPIIGGKLILKTKEINLASSDAGATATVAQQRQTQDLHQQQQQQLKKRPPQQQQRRRKVVPLSDCDIFFHVSDPRGSGAISPGLRAESTQRKLYYIHLRPAQTRTMIQPPPPEVQKKPDMTSSSGKGANSVLMSFDDKSSFNSWLSALRLAKFGNRLKDSFAGGGGGGQQREESSKSAVQTTADSSDTTNFRLFSKFGKLQLFSAGKKSAGGEEVTLKKSVPIKVPIGGGGSALSSSPAAAAPGGAGSAAASDQFTAACFSKCVAAASGDQPPPRPRQRTAFKTGSSPNPQPECLISLARTTSSGSTKRERRVTSSGSSLMTSSSQHSSKSSLLSSSLSSGSIMMTSSASCQLLRPASLPAAQLPPTAALAAAAALPRMIFKQQQLSQQHQQLPAASPPTTTTTTSASSVSSRWSLGSSSTGGGVGSRGGERGGNNNTNSSSKFTSLFDERRGGGGGMMRHESDVAVGNRVALLHDDDDDVLDLEADLDEDRAGREVDAAVRPEETDLSSSSARPSVISDLVDLDDVTTTMTRLDDVIGNNEGEEEEESVFVAVDRSDGEFKIVTDPKKIQEIRLDEVSRRRRNVVLQRQLLREPWYTCRPSSFVNDVISRLGTTDGFFLIRSSNYRCSEYPGLETFALTLNYREKLVIFRIIQKRLFDKTVFTLDNGATQFPSLRSLVDFYQMNRGPLPCLLTDYPVL